MSDEIKRIFRSANDIWEARFYLRRWMLHRTLAPYIGAPIFYLAYFVLPVTTMFLTISSVLRLSTKFDLPRHLSQNISAELLLKIVLASAIIYFIIFYLFLIRYPRCSKKKIGIGVAFAYDFVSIERLKSSLRNRDLVIRELEKIIDQEKLGHVFKVIKLYDYHGKYPFLQTLLFSPTTFETAN